MLQAQIVQLDRLQLELSQRADVQAYCNAKGFSGDGAARSTEMLLGGPTSSVWMDTAVMTVSGGKVCKPSFLTADGESCLKVLLG